MLTSPAVTTRKKLRAAGRSNAEIRAAVHDQALTPLLPGVFLQGGKEANWRQLVEASLLWAGEGSAAAGETAASLWGLGTFPTTSICIAVPGSPKLPESLGFELVLWRARKFGAWDLDTKDGLKLTRVERTLLDLGGGLDPRSHEKLVAEAIKKKLTTELRLRACHKRLRASGRKGAGAMQALFDRRGYSLRRLESDLEDALLAILQSKELPEPRQQFEWPLTGRPEYRLDFAYPEQKLAIEADGYLCHSSEADWSGDQTRMNALVEDGWAFLRFTRKDLAKPARVAEIVRNSLRVRGYKFPKR